MIHHLFAFIVFLTSLACIGQPNIPSEANDNGETDSIQNIIDTLKGKEKVQFLNNQAADILMQNPSLSFEYAQEALNIAKNNSLKKEKATALKLLAEIYSYKSDYERSLDYYQQALHIYRSVQDTMQVANMINRLGYINEVWKNYDEALQYYLRSLSLFRSVDNAEGLSSAYNNLAIIYGKTGKDDSSLYYYKKAYDIQGKIGNKEGKGIMANNLGQYYITHGEPGKGSYYYKEALKLFEEIKNWYGYAFTIHNLGVVDFEKKNYAEALEKYHESLKYAKKYGLKELQGVNYESLSRLYDSVGNVAKAYHYYKMNTKVKDSVFNADVAKKISDLKNQFQIEKKEQEIQYLRQENELKDLKNKRNRNIIIIGIVFIIFIVVIGILIYRAYRIRTKANKLLRIQKEEISGKNEELRQQQEEIIAQRDDLEELNQRLTEQKQNISTQNEQISLKNQYITDSIEYAKYIQSALLVPMEVIWKYFPDSFIFYKPKDIVSGDFFWLEEKANKVFFAAVDCTGHGVPGAFMSIVGHNLLSKAVNDKKIEKPSEILNFLNEGVYKALRKHTHTTLMGDGMDMALCVFDKEAFTLEYAGAFSPLYHIRGEQLNRFKADALPIGTTFSEDFSTFRNNLLELHKNDIIYIFSDGFVDQFGGKRKKKFQSKRFKHLLLEIKEQPMQLQGEIIQKTFDDWKGDNIQIDDILVVGIRI